MFFDDVSQIRGIAIKNGTSIFVVPDDVSVEISGAIMLQPDEKKTITIEQVRKIMQRLGLKQVSDVFVIIRPADLLGLEAANAMLKSLEEPGDKVHYALITDKPSKLLPTILSRSAMFFLRNTQGFSLEIDADMEAKELAKKLIAARPRDLIDISNDIASRKKTARADALDTLALAIDMLYKSYFITGKATFVKKIPKYLTAYDNIRKNGHVKLHLIADLC